MVDQKTGSERLRVRKHMDHMKRATVLDQTYFHQVGDEESPTEDENDHKTAIGQPSKYR